MTELSKDNTTEKLKMTENLRHKALHRFQLCLRAIKIWIFAWPAWYSWVKCSDEDLLASGISTFIGIFVLFWPLSLWLKKKMSPASAYTWFWMTIWFVVGVLLDIPMTIGIRLMTLVIASVFSYYFWMGVNATKILSQLKRTEQENIINSPQTRL